MKYDYLFLAPGKGFEPLRCAGTTGYPDLIVDLEASALPLQPPGLCHPGTSVETRITKVVFSLSNNRNPRYGMV